MDDLIAEVVVSAPIDRAWVAWTSTERIKEWFSPQANIDPRPGGFFELYFDPDNHGHMSTKGCVFIRIEPRASLTFTWKGPDQFARLMNDPSRLTTVRVEFHELGEMTRMIVTHMGWGDGEGWVEAREWHKTAWKNTLEQLKSVLESE